jgi:hypothetical protein
MGDTDCTYGRNEKAYKILFRKSEGIRPEKEK